MATINDIAKLAKVSKSTVSRYLNNGSVSKETSEKLEKIIKDLDYKPNSFAQSLKASKTNIIGTIIPNFIGFSKNITLTAIDSELKKNGMTAFIANSGDEIDREIDIINNMVKQKVDGILLFGSEITERHIKTFENINIPIVVIGQKVDQAYCVFHNDYKAGKLIGQHIKDLGHKKITYFGVGDYDKSLYQRYLGMKEVLSDECEVIYHELNFKVEDSYVELLNTYEEDKSTYYVCATDNMAYGIIQGFRKLGLSVPTDVSVSGFGNYDINNIMSPLLTTVNFDYTKIGEIAVEKLLKLVNKEETEKATMLDCNLIKRESTRAL